MVEREPHTPRERAPQHCKRISIIAGQFPRGNDEPSFCRYVRTNRVADERLDIASEGRCASGKRDDPCVDGGIGPP
jgi:hypothetical protein